MPASSESATLPTPAVVVLVGAPASGKSTWAAANFRVDQIVSADVLRGVVGEHELDLSASDDAFLLLDQILAMRCQRGLTTVIDTTGLDASRRRLYQETARGHDLPVVAVRFTTSAAECKRRNRERAHPVPVKVIHAMSRQARTLDLEGETWDLIIEPQATTALVDSSTVQVATRAKSPELEPNASRAPATLRFGLHLSSFDWPGGSEAIGPTLTRIADEAEAAGFDSLWVMDHMIQIPQLGRAWDPMLESFTTLGFLAQATRRIRLGVLVSAVTFRNIGHLAKLVATLDVLSGGRAIAGIGAANSKAEHDAYGWDFPPAPQRLALLEEVLQALPLLWGPGSPSFEGELVKIPEAVGYPRPLQDPMPLIVGGSGERVTLRLAAQYASGANLFGSPEVVAAKVAVLHDHCRRLGRDPAEVEVTHLRTALVAAHRQDLDDRVERLRPSRQGPDRFAKAVNAGTVDDHEQTYRAYVDAGVSTVMISVPDVAAPGSLAPVAELIGRFRG